LSGTFISEQKPCPVGPRQAGQFSASAVDEMKSERIKNVMMVFMRKHPRLEVGRIDLVVGRTAGGHYLK
jgi:hypothetical protein